MIKGMLAGDKIISNSADAFSTYERSRIGEKEGRRIEYNSVEALYLIDKAKMEVFSDKGEKIDFEKIIGKIRKSDKRIDTKFKVFSDMRKRGYILKSALKFGADFRVYNKGEKPGEEHARWILFCVKESESFKWHEFAAKNRIAHSTNKKLLLGVLDDEGDVSYYEIGWQRL